MELFYSTSMHDNHFLLEGEEAHHLLKVLRHRSGDTVMITDGKGFIYTTEILVADPKKCVLKIKHRKESENQKPYRLHIGIAPTKNADRFEWFLEKATEIGIDEVTPIFCEHSERRIIKEERLIKVLVSAMKQSLKSYLPVLHPAQNFGIFLKQVREPQRYICTMDSLEYLTERYKQGEACLILIGPEGDFSKEEVKQAVAHGFVPVSLGNSRLRTETAGLMVCSALAFLHTPK